MAEKKASGKTSKERVLMPRSEGVEMVAFINDRALAVRLKNDSQKMNGRVEYLMTLNAGTKLPKEMIRSAKTDITEAVATAKKSISEKVDMLQKLVIDKGIKIPERSKSRPEVIKYVTNNRLYSEHVQNYDLADQAIWILKYLSISLLLSEEKRIVLDNTIRNLLGASENVIKQKYMGIRRLLTAEGKVNEVAVAMPVDKDAIPDPLVHPLIGIEEIHKVKNELVVVDHPVRSYADAKAPAEAETTEVSE